MKRPSKLVKEIGATSLEIILGVFLLAVLFNAWKTSETQASPTNVSAPVKLKSPKLKLKSGSLKLKFAKLKMTAAPASMIKALPQVGTPCFPAPANLISWWTGDGDATDFQGNNDGTLQGDTTFAAAKVGQGFSFDGTGDFVEAPDDPSLDVGISDFSIDAWIQTSNASGMQTIVDKRTQPSPGVFFGYSFFTLNGNLGVQLADGTSTDFVSTTNVANGALHLVAVTVDRDSMTGGVLYVDGTAVLTFDPTTRAGNLDNSADFRIGADSPDAGGANFFTGLVDELELFKRALTAMEVQSIFTADSSGKCKCAGITCPANVTVSNDADQCGAVVNYSAPTPIGPDCGAVTCTPASGSFFPVGVTTVSCTVVNDSGPTCPPATINGTLGSGSLDWPSVSGTQTGRLDPNGTASSCAVPKACTPLDSTPGRAFDAYTFTNSSGATACVTATLNVLTQTMADYQVNAYLGSYDPANICTNYLADPGMSSGSPPAPISFSFNVPAGMDFLLVVHTVNAGETGGQYQLTLSGDQFCATEGCSFTVTVNDTQPPTITCPANVTAMTTASCPISAGGSVSFPAPTASDNCPGVTTVCVPASGSMFPVGTTTVTCTATDASGNTASCSFSVTSFNGCLQDDSKASKVVVFNTFTGEYTFCCGGTTLTGTGTVSVQGCYVTIQHNRPDRRVLIKIDFATKKGTASMQSPLSAAVCTITDKNILNNTCACSIAP